jgi:hypothetical protein
MWKVKKDTMYLKRDRDIEKIRENKRKIAKTVLTSGRGG